MLLDDFTYFSVSANEDHSTRSPLRSIWEMLVNAGVIHTSAYATNDDWIVAFEKVGSSGFDPGAIGIGDT